MGKDAGVEKTADVSEKIIEAAKKHFAYFGYKKTTVDEIAKEAGISKGAVYLHFSNKEDILLEVIIRHVVERLVIWDEIIATDKPAPEKIDEMFRSYIESTLERKEMVFAAHHQRLEEAPSEDTKGKLFATIVPKLIAALEKVIAIGIDEGSIRSDTDKTKLAMIIVIQMRYSIQIAGNDQFLDWRNAWSNLWTIMNNGGIRP